MSIAPTVPIERIVNVLHGIALRGQTGLLLVQRASGEEQEQGEVFLEHGETIFARTPERIGEAALAQMMKWEKVSTTFHEGVVASSELRSRYSIKRNASDTGPLMPIELQKTHLLPVIRKTSLTPEREAARKTPSREIPALRWKRETYREQSAPEQQQTAPLPVRSRDRVAPAAVYRVHELIGLQQVIAGLDRRDRLVFLLLDGRRSMREIASLIHRGEMDVIRVLERFLALGLIECVQANDAV